MKPLSFRLDGREASLEWEPSGPGTLRLRLPGEERAVEVAVAPLGDGSWRLSFEGGTHRAVASRGKEGWRLLVDGASFAVAEGDSVRKGGGGAAGPARTAAPMPGIVRKVLVAAGDAVAKGQTVVLMEAMKMECPVPAGRDGVVKRVCVEPGKTVDAGTELVVVE